MFFQRLEIWNEETEQLLRTLVEVQIFGVDGLWTAKSAGGEAEFGTWGDYPVEIGSEYLSIRDGHLKGQDAPDPEHSAGEWRLFTQTPSAVIASLADFRHSREANY